MNLVIKKCVCKNTKKSLFFKFREANAPPAPQMTSLCDNYLKAGRPAGILEESRRDYLNELIYTDIF